MHTVKRSFQSSIHIFTSTERHILVINTIEICCLSNEQRITDCDCVVACLVRHGRWTGHMKGQTNPIIGEDGVSDDNTFVRPCENSIIQILPYQETFSFPAMCGWSLEVDSMDTGVYLFKLSKIRFFFISIPANTRCYLDADSTSF